MKELSLNILDIAQNSFSAGASLTEVILNEDKETLEITIKDNGCGMDEETLQKVMTKVEDYTKKRRKSSIGLYNINRRIKLSYGEQYGLTIQSTPGEGTMVRVTFPVIKTEKEEIETH